MGDNKSKTEEESGDPGRTPGSAEGDLETVEADLKEKDLDGEPDDKKNRNSNRNASETGSSNN